MKHTSPLFTRTIVLALLPFGCGFMMSYLLRAVNAVVGPELVTEFGFGAETLGFLTAAYLLTFSLFQLPVGVLLDRYGPRTVQSLLLCVAALGCLLFAAASQLWMLVAARGLIGLGFAAGLMASYKSSADWVPLERRSLANTMIMAMGALGIIVSTEPTALLVQGIGWRMTFVVLACAIVLVAAFIYWVAPQKPPAEGIPLRRQTEELMSILRMPLFWRVAPLLGLTAGIPIALQTLWAGPWYRDVMGFAPMETARHLFWMAVAFLVGILSVGVIADRLQARGISPMHTMFGFLILHMAAQLVLCLQIRELGFAAWLVLSSVGQVAILAFPWFQVRVGENLAGRSNSTINFAMFVCAFTAQYGVGWIIGRYSQTTTGYDPRAYQTAFALLLILQVAAVLWYLFAPQEEHSK